MSNSVLRFIALCNGVQCALHVTTVAYVANLFYKSQTITAQVEVTTETPANSTPPSKTTANSTGASSKPKSSWF